MYTSTSIPSQYHSTVLYNMQHFGVHMHVQHILETEVNLMHAGTCMGIDAIVNTYAVQ